MEKTHRVKLGRCAHNTKMDSLTCDKDGFTAGVNKRERPSAEQQEPGDKPDGQVKSHEQHRGGLQDSADGVGAKEEHAHPEQSHTGTRSTLRQWHGGALSFGARC